MKDKKEQVNRWQTVMFCIDCEYAWDSYSVSDPCPKCASKAVQALSHWKPVTHGMPNLNGRIPA